MKLLAAAAALAFALACAAQEPLADDGDLAAAFACEVDMRLAVPEEEGERYARELDLALLEHGILETVAQYAVVIDRSANVQAGFLLRMQDDGAWRFVGAVPVSTGRPGEYEHFETPLGVFVHSPANPDFRAEGTFNENGIRGYGRAGMRVFDLGWVTAPRGWGDRHESVMRLQMHATDPDALEGWLGARRSKGCIRVPASFDLFLDSHGVLDAEYASLPAQAPERWVVDAGRSVTPLAGRYVVVIDTQRAARPSWARAPNGRAWRSPRAAQCVPRSG